MIRRLRPLTDHEQTIWQAFIESYLASNRQSGIDTFLRALFGTPRG